tara:strand:+ start:316 stop:519 length:204 start_codon:yes stop_codon:yes gene_type:complete
MNINTDSKVLDPINEMPGQSRFSSTHEILIGLSRRSSMERNSAIGVKPGFKCLSFDSNSVQKMMSTQ